MQLSGEPLASPVEGWGDDLHRLLDERATWAGQVGSDDIENAGRRQPVGYFRRAETPIAAPTQSWTESRSSSSASRTPRVLPARSTEGRFSSIASAFEIYVEPDPPAAPTVYANRQSTRRSRTQSYARIAPASRSFVFTSHAEKPAGVAEISTDESLTDVRTRPDSWNEHPVEEASSQLTDVTQRLSRGGSGRIHPVASMLSISSDSTEGLSSSSQPGSVRSFQITPPASIAHSPATLPRRPMVNTHYTRPMAPEGIPSKTPLVEVGPSWDGVEVPEVISPPSNDAVSSPIRRRTQSYYAFTDAKSDQLLNTDPTKSINLAPGNTTVDSRTLSTDSLPTSPSFKEARPTTAFLTIDENSEVSDFAPRPRTPMEPESYSAFHILPEDHTDRVRHSPDQATSPLRRKPVPRSPSQPSSMRVTDTFKEPVTESALRARQNIPGESGSSSLRPRQHSGSSYGSMYSDMDPSSLQRMHDSTAVAYPRNTPGEYRQISDSGRSQVRRPNSMGPQASMPVYISKEIVPRTQSQAKPINDVQIAPGMEPRSHLEMIRQRNMERKRGKRNTLRIVNT